MNHHAAPTMRDILNAVAPKAEKPESMLNMCRVNHHCDRAASQAMVAYWLNAEGLSPEYHINLVKEALCSAAAEIGYSLVRTEDVIAATKIVEKQDA